MEFSDKAKYVRMKLELNQKALAEELGVTYATVSRWKNENRTSQMATLGKFYNFCEQRGIDFEDTGEFCSVPRRKELKADEVANT